MQPPLFDVAQPQYLNYGALGSIAGRELADTFDPAGEHGGRRVQFDAGTRRLAVQPGRPTARGVSGDQAPAAAGGADGVGAANAAWARHRSMRDWDLPGLERRFTHEQLFFVAGVAFACGGTGRERGGRVPALGAVAGLEAFREAFKCPVVEPTYKP
jgi:endothelin-converting enzyme